MFQCPLLLPADAVGVRPENEVVCCFVGSKHWIATKQIVVDRGAMLALSGGWAMGRVGNVFKCLDKATALLLMQILPMELTI